MPLFAADMGFRAVRDWSCYNLSVAKTPKKRSGKPVLGGRGTLYAPTEAKPRWQCAIHDPVTLKRRIFSAVSQDAVLDKARRALGDWDPVEETRTSRPPTLQEAFDAWLQDESGRWSDRTPQAYRTRFNTHLKDLAEVPVTAIKPADLRDVALGTSREQARRVRTIVRAIFDSTERWHGRKGQLYGDAVALPESRSSDTPRTVESTQIPNSDWINGVVDCAWSTYQLHPAKAFADDAVDPVTGEHVMWNEDLFNDPMLAPRALCLGMPLDSAAVRRRGIPAHYKNVEQRQRDQTVELASRMRQVALAHALGAAAGLRVGEVYALRVWHLFHPWTTNTARLIDSAMHTISPREAMENYGREGTEGSDGLLLPGWTGKIEVCEQVSSPSIGPMQVSPPKMGKARQALALPFLYPAWDSSSRTLRELLIDATERHGLEFDAFSPHDGSVPLWRMTTQDALKLWRVGFTPISLLVHDRLRELWLQSGRRLKVFRNMLLLPTRNKARGDGPSVRWPARWPYPKDIPFGNYQNPKNVAHRFTNPLYDWVSEVVDNWPGYHAWGGDRRGFVHHSTRHWYCSATLHHKVSLPVVSKSAGHSSPAFTLLRYSSSLPTEEFGLE